MVSRNGQHVCWINSWVTVNDISERPGGPNLDDIVYRIHGLYGNRLYVSMKLYKEWLPGTRLVDRVYSISESLDLTVAFLYMLERARKSDDVFDAQVDDQHCVLGAYTRSDEQRGTWRIDIYAPPNWVAMP